MEAFTGLYMSTARVDRIMEPALVGDPLAPAPLECPIKKQDQGRIGSQKGLSEQLQEDPAEARTETRRPD